MSRFRNDSIFWVEVEKIIPNPYQPRREFDEAKLKELSESIRMYGVLQPLTVSRQEVELENGGLRTEYELIAGERRLRASKLAGISQVPVLIREGEESEQEKLELAIIENLQREDLNAVDRALAFKQLAEEFGMSHVQVAKKVGRSREYVSNSIRLLGLREHMLESLKRAEINEGHARTLLMLNDRPEEQETVFREIILKKLSVREVERIARKIATDKVRKKDWKGSDPVLIEKERQFTETLGTRVQIAKTDFGGKLTIDYFSEEDLDHLLSLLKENQKISVPQSAIAVAAVAEEIEVPGTVDQQDSLEAATGLTFEITAAEDDVVPENVPLIGEDEIDEDEAGAVEQEIAVVDQKSDDLAVVVEPEQDLLVTAEPVVPATQTEPTPAVAPTSSEAAATLQERIEARLAETDTTTPEPAAQNKEDDSGLYNLSNYSL